MKCLRNFASYSLQAPWGWHDSVETCRNVIICEIILHFLVAVQNKNNKNQKCLFHTSTVIMLLMTFRIINVFLNFVSGLVFQEGVGVKFAVVWDWMLYNLEDKYCCLKLTCRIFWNRKIGVDCSSENFAPTRLQVIKIHKSVSSYSVPWVPEISQKCSVFSVRYELKF
jgi:hypothetical protein